MWNKTYDIDLFIIVTKQLFQTLKNNGIERGNTIRTNP